MAVEPTSKDIFVSYRRDGKAETFSGHVSAPDREEPRHCVKFWSCTFSQILALAQEALLALPEHRLLLKREEAPYAMLLPDGLEDLLRRDLDAAVAALTVGPQRVIVGTTPKRPFHMGSLRHGHDTLAEALGEELYLRARRRLASWEVEDPTTGRWTAVVDGTPGRSMPRCGNLSLTSLIGPWATAATAELLELALPRYYLPRRWNPSEGWITHDSLVEMYEVYRKEKSDVTGI